MTHGKSISAPSPSDGRRGRILGALTLLGALAALWALYLWSELVAARRGGTPFCAFGESDCAALWDAGFATAIHRATGMPVAGWGLVWGIVALVLPVAALVAASEGRASARVAGAIRATAAAGALGVVALLAASAQAGMFCTSCALTYLFTIAYAVVALGAPTAGAPRFGAAGIATAAGATAAVFLLLLYPGLRTPRDAMRAGDDALRAVPPAAAAAAGRVALPDADARLAALIADLRPEARQALADSLLLYARSPAVPAQPPRALAGPADAPVRITAFTDALCSHCATLHGTLEYLATLLPAGSFSVDSRQFPLDGNCNAHLPVRGAESVRCLASRARICFDATPRAKEFASALYARQADLAPEVVFEVAAPFVARAELERCVASPATARQLAADVDYAWRFEPDGTPLVLVNGRRGTSFGPFLYALVLSGGDADHPAFRALPPANPEAHLH